jgi:hypothetical protein
VEVKVFDIVSVYQQTSWPTYEGQNIRVILSLKFLSQNLSNCLIFLSIMFKVFLAFLQIFFLIIQFKVTRKQCVLNFNSTSLFEFCDFSIFYDCEVF